MEIKKLVPVDIYCCKVAVVLTDNMESTLKKYFKKFKFPFDDGLYYGMFISPPIEIEDDIYYIILNSNDLSINTITHESYHACVKILKDRDVGMEDEEPMAYLIGYMVESILKIIIAQNINLSNGAK